MMHLAPEYSENEIPRQFRDLATVYLDGAERLCREMVTGSWAASFNRGQVCLWLAFHATELFLKSCIRRTSPKHSLNTHSLGELMLVFSSLFPNVPFEPPFGSEPVLADPELMAAVVHSDATLHEQLRYPIDRSGLPWGGVRAFTPEMFLADLQRLRGDIERVSSIVFTKDHGEPSAQRRRAP